MSPLPFVGRRRRQEEDDRAHAAFLARRRYLSEDVTVFGEQLGQLHLDTLTDTLGEDARDYYRYALESYERAKAGLQAAQDEEQLEVVATALVDGRHQQACVLAIVAGQPMPLKLAECFFNPQHGPSSTEVAWTPPGGVERRVPVCAADADRIAHGQAPKMRLVRVGDRYGPMVVAEHEESWLRSTIDKRAVVDGRRDANAAAAVWGFDGQAHSGGSAI